MSYGLTLAHQGSSQAQQTFGTPQAVCSGRAQRYGSRRSEDGVSDGPGR
jgi:hypothetical protein